MQMRMIVNRAAALLLLLPGLAAAEVLRSDDTGFEVRHVAELAGGPMATWDRLVRPADWWHPDHTWSADAGNLSLDPRAGGCFCEALADGGSNEHLRVVHAAPGRLLRMDGRLGPLQPLPLNGVLSFELEGITAEDGAERTTVTLRYVVAGPPGMGLAQWAGPVDGVLGQQLQRLAAAGD